MTDQETIFSASSNLFICFLIVKENKYQYKSMGNSTMGYPSSHIREMISIIIQYIGGASVTFGLIIHNKQRFLLRRFLLIRPSPGAKNSSATWASIRIGDNGDSGLCRGNVLQEQILSPLIYPDHYLFAPAATSWDSSKKSLCYTWPPAAAAHLNG